MTSDFSEHHFHRAYIGVAFDRFDLLIISDATGRELYCLKGKASLVVREISGDDGDDGTSYPLHEFKSAWKHLTRPLEAS